MTKPTGRAAIERRLQLHVLNLCLAVVGKKDGLIEKAKVGLFDEVEEMLKQAAIDARRAGT